MTLPASSEVLERSLDRIAFLIGKTPALRPINHNAKNTEEALDAPVAVLEHANRIIKTTVRPRANLNRHRFPSIPDVPMIVVHSSAKTVLCALENMKSRCCFHLQGRLYVALRNVGAARLFGGRFAVQRVWGGWCPATNLFEFARSALPLKLRRIAQIAE